MIVLKTGDGGSGVIALDNMTLARATGIARGCAGIDPWKRYAITANQLESYLTAIEPGAPRYVLSVDHVIAGAAGFRQDWLRGPYLQFLAILPEHQRKGLGQCVLAWFEGMARARGDKNLWVAASDFNTGALHFYEQHGFQRVALLDGLVRAGFSEVLYRKML